MLDWEINSNSKMQKEVLILIWFANPIEWDTDSTLI